MTTELRPLRILLLGGTTEASSLAKLLAGRREFDCVLSLAGRTANPDPAPIPMRTGGFGGAEGLAAYIAQEKIDVVVDATHPFAAQMSRNAVTACGQSGGALVVIERPEWKPIRGDRWQSVADVAAGIAAIGTEPRRVLIATGRQQLAELEAAPQHHYVIRVIDPPEKPLRVPDYKLIQARGPFTVAGDLALMGEERIEVIVAKNAGGKATASKLEAARELGIPVIMVARPDMPERRTLATAEAAFKWLVARHAGLAKRGV